jgi:hypothetical protein
MLGLVLRRGVGNQSQYAVQCTAECAAVCLEPQQHPGWCPDVVTHLKLEECTVEVQLFLGRCVLNRAHRSGAYR